METTGDSGAPTPTNDHALIERFPLRPIRSDEGLARAIAVMQTLTGRDLNESVPSSSSTRTSASPYLPQARCRSSERSYQAVM